MTRIDLDKLSPDERRRVERALHPRDTVTSFRFDESDIAAWKGAADSADASFVEWAEALLNAAAKLGAKIKTPMKTSSASKMVTFRFNEKDVTAWKQAAESTGAETLTDWVEGVLNAAVKRGRK